MSDEAQTLAKLSDEELDQSAIRAAASERKCMHTVLLHIREIDWRRLYAKRGCESLHEYVVMRMKYSEGSASRRIAAARMLNDNPEIAESVQSGELNLTNILTLRSTIQAEEKRSGEKFGVEEKRELLSMIANKTQAEVTRELVELFPQAVNLTEKTRMVSGNRLQVSMSLEDDQIKRSERVRELASHINDCFAWSELFDFLAQYYLKNEDPLLQPLSKKRNKTEKNSSALANDENHLTRYANGTVPEKASANTDSVFSSEKTIAVELFSQRPLEFVDSDQNSDQKEGPQPQWIPASARHSRYISAHVERALHQRSGSRCEWIDPGTGKRCTRKYHLQVDHRTPISKGGTSELENTQLLCRVHNLLKGNRILSF